MRALIIFFATPFPTNNNNNIERFNAIFPGGIVIGDVADDGTTLFERGCNGCHEPVKIAEYRHSIPVLIQHLINQGLLPYQPLPEEM